MNNLTLLLCSTFTIFSFVQSSFSQNHGSLDASFNVGGSGTDAWIRASVIQADGKILIAGEFDSYNDTPVNKIVRLNEDGSLDPNFDVGLGANNHVYALALQSDGKILVGGNFTYFDGIHQRGIVRLNTNGSLDTMFNTGGMGLSMYQNLEHMTAVVNTIAVQADGKILVGGAFNRYNGNISRRNIIRINSNGHVDDSDFNQFENTFLLPVRSIVEQPDNKILVGGDFQHYVSENNSWNRRITRINPDGSFDSTFSTGDGPNADVRCIALLPDGKIIIGGNFATYNNITVNRLARLNSDGSLDTSFNEDGIGTNTTILSIAVEIEGKILITGWFTEFNGEQRNRIARLNSDGSIDPLFDPGEGAQTGTPSFVNVDHALYQGNGKVIIVGRFLTYDEVEVNNIARIYSGNPAPSASIEEREISFLIYPNPATTTIFLEKKGHHDFMIINLQGQVVKSDNFIDSNQTNIGDLLPGIYFVRIGNQHQRIMVR
jgi:uncharacterized delta-60 repeat protein